MADNTPLSEAPPAQGQSQAQQLEQPGEKPRPSPRRRSVNVGEAERYGSIVGGLALVLAAVARRGLGGLIFGGLGAVLIRRGVLGHCPMYESMGASTARPQRHGVPGNIGVRVERSITINRSAHEIFKFLRDSRNLPHFMKQLERVEVIDAKRSHWVAKAFQGRALEWDVEIINEHPNELIAWESQAGAKVPNAGSIRLKQAPNGRGTEVRIALEVNPPAGMLGVFGAKLFGETPERAVEEDLALLKQVSETGEIATTEGQPTGRR